MTIFKVYNLDETVWNKLINKIEIIKKNTALEIEESVDLKNQRDIFKKSRLKYTKFFFFTFFILFFTSLFLFFNNIDAFFIDFLCGLATCFLFICFALALGSYYRSYSDFFKIRIANKLETDFIDNDELGLLKKFMPGYSLEEFLANNNLKLSLSNANYILNSDYYQNYYNTQMAKNIVSKL